MQTEIPKFHFYMIKLALYRIFMFNILPLDWMIDLMQTRQRFFISNSLFSFSRLDDLAHAAHQGTITCQRTIASIFLDLAFNRDIRVQITSRNIPGGKFINFITLNRNSIYDINLLILCQLHMILQNYYLL
jgi:hypothetical protein